ncbi:hypothetical protein LJB95_00365, partial [Paludibacteraceae bacterium OttesenSCG-928-F17]|nr:hypothetical protein [Paludibacteraceae bacterium OttesenSCG-928-F17]
YFIPIFMLYKFSVNARKAVEMNNTRFFTQSLRFLDNHYKIIGVMTIVSIIFFIFSLSRIFFLMRGVMM